LGGRPVADSVGAAAFDAIVQIGKAAVPTLLAIESDNATPSAVRGCAIMALGSIRDSRALDQVLAALRDEDLEIRRSAGLAMEGWGDPRAAETLLRVARDANENQQIRWYAIDALCDIPDPRLVEPLLAFVKDERFRDTILRRGPSRDPRFLEPLLAAVRAEPRGRDAACAGLGRLGSPRALDALLAVLHDGKEDSGARFTAAEAIAGSGDRKAIDELLRFIERGRGKPHSLPNEFIRALRSSADDRALDRLFAAVWEPDFAESAGSALKEVASPRAVSRLLAVVADPRPYPLTKLYACAALLRIHDPAAVGGLVSVVSDRKQTSDNRRLAIMSLQRFEDRRAVPALTEALKDKEAVIRKDAASALGGIGNPRAVEALTRLSQDEDKSVRAEAKTAIEKIKELSLE
jgi:HEAT repeat protein